jgi:hypothetical protein
MPPTAHRSRDLRVGSPMLDGRCKSADGATMKAIVIHQFGNADVFNVEDVSQPTLGAGRLPSKCELPV